MKINVTTKNVGISLQIFDALYGYLQSLDPSTYLSKVEITVDAPYSSADRNILFDYMPTEYSKVELTKYDLILFCNGGEPLTVSTKTMGDLIDQKNVYLITNSYLLSSHSLWHKVLWYPHNAPLCRDFWTRNFYPQYYENIKNRSITRKSEIVAINGSVRTNRYYFFDLLQQQIPNILQLSKIGASTHKLNDCQWESEDDTKFRQWVNARYQDNSIPEPDQYYSKSVTVGIDGKFGSIPPGYFIMPEYWEYACVVFPESTWQNNELALTEKALKCFYAGCLPFPIGGAGINQLYNDIGFYTAWNLLPDHMQKFDKITDHEIRYQRSVDAIGWLNSNRSVFDSQIYKKAIDQNRTNFLTCNCSRISISRLLELLQTKLKVDFTDKIS
jgi:hypothetical protein